MLEIVVPETEMYDDFKGEFIYTKEYTLRLEHSLVSLSKWESKWHKPFLTKTAKTEEETIDYIKCMTLNQNVPNEVYLCLTSKNRKDIEKYIDDPMTATTFNPMQSNRGGSSRHEQPTAELIYYWMISLNIPVEFQKWHVNKLMTLIRVCEIKNTPPKKMSKKDTISRYAQMNAARRAKHNTRG